MFSKPFTIIFVYILTVINFVILVTPFAVVLLPFLPHSYFGGGSFTLSFAMLANIKMSLLLLAFVISFLMLFYLFLDFIFGFSVKFSLKNAVLFEKTTGYELLEDVINEVKKKFAARNVKFYISNSREINAFAVGSFGHRAIVLTKGLLEHYKNNADNEEEFLLAIRSILGHEMSHLINKDFLPGIIIIANQKITNFVSFILEISFNFFIRFITLSRMSSNRMANLMVVAHNFIYAILTFFNRHIIYNLYEFFKKATSRSIEYRADRQSAKAFGGYYMALALAFLGKSSYFTLFSTHPANMRRIKKVQNIEANIGGVIHPSIISSISNYLSFMLLIVTCLVFAKLSKIDILIRYYLINHHHDKAYHYMLSLARIIKYYLAKF